MNWDAIVVGARCAGAPTAMLLARLGWRVLLVDRASFPSDTISTHVIHPRGVAALARWGLRDALAASGCPPIATYAFDFGPVTIEGTPGTDASPVAFCARRTVLDKLLVDAAVAAGATLREGFTVDALLWQDGRVVGVRGHESQGAEVSETARIVIGADGRHSVIAAQVEAPRYNERPPLLCGYYAYWSGLPMRGRFETTIRPQRGFAAAPTHDGQTLVIAGWPRAEFEANKADLERHYLATLALSPAFAARLGGARRESRIAGASVENFFRRPWGPGWVLVGDAGYTKDPITAQGISDAFVDAERVAAALDEALAGRRDVDEAMAASTAQRDESSLPMYEMTCELATLAPPPPPMQALLGAIAGQREAMDGFVRMNAGTIPPAAFFGAVATAGAVPA
ncbi:NAD(P)/FAD-dependent oxidoreductase [Aquabacterium humicola]|uniref:NAD(P)/FAD-dependent oxidoreductase n=1 Tax=Aquabacterium humicola TaxID=3237377 RepID=UPI00254304D0|nr:NAD(P)/FAD-dependent oxidoreductase [Rubrivivax pictus]